MSFESWLAERLVRTNEGRASADRGIFESACPFCRTQEHSFWFSLVAMRGGCLRKVKCGWKGDAVQLVMGLEGCSLREAVAVVRASGTAVGKTSQHGRPASDLETCQLPREYVLLSTQAQIWKRLSGRWRPEHLHQVIRYLVTRKVEFDQVVRHQIGYCLSGKYNDRIILPVIERGEMVYFAARLFRGVGKPYRYPTTTEAGGRGPSDVLFNLDNVRGRPRVRVVEGIFDALAEERRGQAVVAMLGLAVSEMQAAKLALAGCREAIVECDGDAPRREVEKVARRLEGVMRVSIACPERDPDQQMISPPAVSYGLAGRVAGRLRGD